MHGHMQATWALHAELEAIKCVSAECKQAERARVAAEEEEGACDQLIGLHNRLGAREAQLADVHLQLAEKDRVIEELRAEVARLINSWKSPQHWPPKAPASCTPSKYSSFSAI